MAHNEIDKAAAKLTKLKNLVGFLQSSGTKQIKVSLTASEINAIGTTPIEIIPAPGAGKYIHVITGSAFLTWNSVAFDNNTLLIRTIGQGDLWQMVGLLNATADKNSFFENSGGFGDVLAVDTGWEITATDSVATGDSTIDIYVIYTVVTL